MPITPQEALRRLYEDDVPFDSIDRIKFGNYFNMSPDSAEQVITEFRNVTVPHYRRAAGDVMESMYPSLYVNVETPTPGVPMWGAQLGMRDPLQPRDPLIEKELEQRYRQHQERLAAVTAKGTKAPWYERVGAEIMMLGSALPQAAVEASTGGYEEVAEGFVEFPLEGVSKLSAYSERLAEYHPLSLAVKELSPDQYAKFWRWAKRLRKDEFELLDAGLQKAGLSLHYKTPEEAWEETWRMPLTTAVQVSMLYGIGKGIAKKISGKEVPSAEAIRSDQEIIPETTPEGVGGRGREARGADIQRAEETRAETGRAELPQEDTTPQVNGLPVGLKKSEVEAIRRYTDLDKLEAPERVTNEQALTDAKMARVDERALEIADEVIRSKRPITREETAGMWLKGAKLMEEYDLTTADINRYIDTGQNKSQTYYNLVKKQETILDHIDRLTRATDLAGTEAARAFNMRKMYVQRETWDLVNVTQRAQAAKGRKLSSDERQMYQDLVAKHDALKQEYEAALLRETENVAKYERLQAEKQFEVERKKTTIERRKKALRQKIQSERQGVKDDLVKLGFRVNDITGVSAEGAYLVGRLAVSYIREGVADLGAVVKKVQADLPQLKDRDIYQALNARDPNRQIKAQHETVRRIRDLKTQARLLIEIEKAEKGAFDTSRTPKQQSIAVRKLQGRLRDLRKHSYQTGVHPKQLERAIHTINLLQDQLNNHYRSVRRGKPTVTPEYAALREQITDLRSRMRVEDELMKAHDQLKRGEFEVKEPPTPRRISPELERAQIQLKRAKRDISVTIERQKPMTFRRGANEFFNTFRTLKATADMSAVLRQGLVLSLSRPKVAADSFMRSVEAFFSQNKAEQIDMAIRAADHHYIREKSGLYLAELDAPKVNAREEMFMSRLVEKVPGLKHVTQASERHMVTYLNLMRSAAFDEFLSRYPNATHAELTAWANWINVCSGRGNLGKASAIGNELSVVFFAPRFAVSRVQTPYYAFREGVEGRTSPRVRKMVAKDMATTAVLGVTALELADLAGFKVSTNPDSPDFGKIVVGNTRFDLWAGMQQPMRVLARIVKGGGERILKGETDIDPLDLAYNFVRYKASPATTLPYEVLTGKSIIGQKVDLTETAANAITFMTVQDTWEAYKDGGYWRAALVAPAAFFGIGASTYESKKKKSGD